MDATATPRGRAAESAGELVLENGPQKGMCRALIGPLTFIGRAEWCDLRIDAEEVSPWHCVVARGEAGLVLRDLHSGTGTAVNGQAATTRPLHDGDLLTVGPLQLRVRWNTSHATPADSHEQSRRELESLRDTILRERTNLQLDRQRFEERVALVQQDMASDRVAMAERQKALRGETEHLGQLRRRAGERWRRHWTAERARVRAVEDSLAEERRRLEAERSRFHEDRLRANGEIELGRRQLQAAAEDLRLARQEHADQVAEAARRLHEREEAVRQREVLVAEAHQQYAREVQHWELARTHAQQELVGLENRVRNFRHKLTELELEVSQREARLQEMETRELPGEPLAAPVVAVRETFAGDVGKDLEEQLAVVEELAGALMDQRWHVAEQCEYLARAREHWDQERVAVAAELEALAQRLTEREQGVREQERAAAARERELNQRRLDLERALRQAEVEQARRAVQHADWQAERDRLLTDVQDREVQLAHSLDELAVVRERWHAQSQEELERLRTERALCEEFRRQCADLWADLLHRRAGLEQQQRTLAARSLALEQCRLESVARAPAPEAAQRLDQLQRRWTRLGDRAAQVLAKERQQLHAEAARLAELTRRLHERAETLHAGERDLARRQSAWEHLQAVLVTENGQLRQQVLSLNRQRLRYAGQVGELHEEVEHLAGLLLEAPAEEAPRLGQAA